jgi:zinc transport system substrate-binding protein
MKRLIIYPTWVLIFSLTIFSGGCLRTKPSKANDKINVTSVIFPSYDFVRTIAGDKVNLTMLLPPGSESHSYEPTPQDIIAIKNSNLFIYPGGENSKWVERILDSISNLSKDMMILNMIDLVDAVEEEIVEGMEGEEEEETAFDEHVWTSPQNAKTIAIAITDSLCELDSVNADYYRQNFAAYSTKLDELDASFKAVVDGAKRKTIIFGDRFPFRYLADAYGLDYFAAFPGCSTDTEPSAATVAFLINKVKSEKLPVIFHIELSNEKMADTISEATGAKKLLLHSCHNLTKNEFEKGITYLDVQKANVVNLREALW